MTNEEAMGVLGLNPPLLADARSLGEATAILDEWQRNDLKSAYRTRCKERHPDLGKSDEDKGERETDMKEINLAYQVLKDVVIQDNRRPQMHSIHEMVIEMLRTAYGFDGHVRIHVAGGHIVIVQGSSSTSRQRPDNRKK